jgi:xanthine/uracil permease
MQWKYDLDESTPFSATIILGLQWAVIAITTIVILGKIVGSLYLAESGGEIVYLQKLFFITGAALLSQLLWGHRLPLISGPAAVLLVGIVSSRGFQASAIHTSMMIGGVFIAILAATGMFSHLRKLFTARVISVVLLLIVFALAPAIRDLMIDAQSGISPVYNITFAILLAFALFLFHRSLPENWRMALIVCSILCGSILYFLIFPQSFNKDVPAHGSWLGFFWADLTLKPSFAPGILLSFLICYLALTINDFGSIQSLNEMLNPDHKDRRIKRGIIFTGAANLASGFFGVIGPVNYSLSPGVIAATGCASRYPLFPAGIFILALSFFPRLIGIMGSVPSVVIGGVMLYIMASQIAAGLQIALQDCIKTGFSFKSGIIMGMPVLLGNIVAFLPAQVLDSIPSTLQPVLGNGFVAGVIAVLFLEHIVFK